MEKILVLNAGSTTVKFQLYNMGDDYHEIITGGQVERIGQDGSKLIINTKTEENLSYELPIKNHKAAVREILAYLTKKYIKNTNEIAAVAHRMGYGGKYGSCVPIDDEVMQTLYDSIPLIPIHGPAIEKGILAAKELMPDVLQTAIFDTAYHQTLKKEAYLCALPEDIREGLAVRRYGFHGPSHHYVTDLAASKLGHKGRFICCHLGGGASVTAVNNGKSVMTSMGFTPMSGLMMSTRPGDIDPYIPLHIMKTQNMSPDEVNAMLNKESGLYALTGGILDMRDILERAKNGDEKCSFAIKAYVYNIIKTIGSYVALLGGIDALIFTAGIGEKSSYIRKLICEKLAFLGLELDENANNQYPAPTMINSETSAVKVMVIPTNEELMMAEESYDVYKSLTEEEKEAI